MIKIFNATDTDFNSGGNIIIEPIKCREFKKKSLNGWYIEVEVPIKYKDYIEENKLVVVQTKSKLIPQAFRITQNLKITTRKISFTARHIMYDAEKYFLLDVRPTDMNGINGLNYINARTDKISPFIFASNVENTNTAYFVRKNLLEAMQEFEEKWNGVFDADNFNISFMQNIGQNNGESIIYGKNAQSVEIFEDWSGVVTKLYPVGYEGIMLPEKYLESDVQYEVPYTKTIDFETDLENENRTEANLITELRSKANKYLQENKVPKISYTVKSDINDKMEIGDTIQILHPLISIETEVLEYEYDCISKKVKSITFGNFTRSIKNKFDNIKTTLNKISNVVSNQEIVINRQTDLINSLNQNGYVYIDDNEILILDRLPKEQATNVWRWGLGGLGFSSHGCQGPFETAITMDGQINANFITTGQLSVSRIEGLANTLNEHSQNIANIELDINGITNTVSSVQTKLNNMQIGGTNLCVGTKLMPTNTQTLKPYSMYFSYNNNINLAELEDNFRAVHITTNDSWKGITCKEFNRLKPKVNEEYIIQTMVKSSGYTGEIGFYAMIYDSNNSKKTGSYFYLEKPDGTHTNSYYIGTILSLSDNTNEKLWLKLKPTQLLIDLINAGGHVELSFQTHNLVKNSNDGYINFWKMKLEKGNMPTDWTPAPEDIENELDTNYYTKTETESKIDQRADSIISTVTSLQTQVNNIQIGGTNILRGTDIVTTLGSSSSWSNGTWRTATSGNGTRERIDITDSPNGNIKKGWRFTRTAESNNGSTDIAQDYVPVANGQTYTMSCWARCVSGNTRLRLQYGKNPWRNNGHPNITDTNWKRYSYTFTVGEHSDGSTNGNTMVYFGLFPYSDNSAGVLEICGLKLESGNKATDWSPAPEDIESNLQNNYYTKTETESKIEQKADSITSTVSQNYSTKAETTQAKNEAINSANTSTDNKLANYSTTTQMNSAITQKANEITTTVTTLENKVNNMQVGGRNLLLNSKTLSGKTGTNIDNDGFSEGYTTGNGTWNEKQYWWSVNATDNPLTGKQVCISLDFKTDDITKINKMAFSIGTYASNKTTRRGDYNLYVTSYKTIDGSDLENNKWTRIYCVATIPSSFTHSDARYYALQTKIAYDAGTPTMYYKKIKIELGNKPTDWSPAPEDIDSNLTTNYYTKTETETKINQKADEISSTVSSVSTKLNNLQIGGTNLLRGTNIVTSLGSSSAWSNGTWRNAGAGTGTRTSISVSDAPNTNIKVGWSTTSTSGQVLISQDNVKTTSGETYTLSCYAKGTGSILLQYGNGTVGYTGSNIQITDANNWKKYVYTFTSRGTANIYLGSNAAGNNVSFCGMKLEKGNMATDWSPAPEDIAANYYTKSETNSQITQKANEISSVISQRISAVQVGGTNLAKNSAPYSLSYWVNFDTTISLVDESSAPFTKAIKVHYADTSGIGTFNSLERRLEIGKEYSWSVYIKASENTELTVGQEQGGTKVVNLTTSWQKFTHTFTADNGQYKNFVFYCYSDAKQNGLDVYIHSLKLEEGNKSTSWSVNPNDEVTEYNVISKINQTAEAVQIDANKISLVGKQINLTGDNTTITSNNFNVNKYGKVTCSDINITSGTISLSGSQGNPDFSCENNDYSNYVTPDGIYINKKEDVSNKHAYVYVDSDGAGITLGGSVANAITMKAGPSPKITCYGNMYSNSYNYNSKEEIKKNITKYKDNALEIIKNGELYEFNYKQEDKNDKKHIGFIIGNKYKTPKEIISQNSEGIDSYTMTSILWKAIQEQQIIIESLIVRMEQLENKLES